MTRYVWDSDKRDWVEPRPRNVPVGPFVWNDLPGYKSPLGTGWIEGRAARREDLKRGGCREVDPSEWQPNPKSSRQVAEERAYLQAREAQKFEMSERIRERLLRGR